MATLRAIIVASVGIAAVSAAPVAAKDLTLRLRTTIGDSGSGFESTEYWGGSKRVTQLTDMSVLVDLDARTITVLDSVRKTYSVKKPPSAAVTPEKAAGDGTPEKEIDAVAVTVTPTGKVEKIAGFDAKEYTFKSSKAHGTLWVTEAFEEPLGVQHVRLALVPNSPGATLASAMEKVKGVPLRTVLILGDASGTKTTTEVLEVKEGVPADAFTIPADYKPAPTPPSAPK
jgi:hypothetical protein